MAQGGLVEKFASRFSIDPAKLMTILKATAFKIKGGEATTEQMAALLAVADQYGLNPFTREIFAFPDKQNGIVPVVGIDGWSRIVNDHAQMDGFEFRYAPDEIKLDGAKECPEWMEVIFYRKDRSHPSVVREYLDEVYKPRGTYPDGNKMPESHWQTHTRRALRHKTFIQGARVTFGFGGIYDEDEAANIIANSERDVTPVATTTARGGVDRMKAAMAIAPGAGNAADIEIPTKVAEPEKVAADPLGDQEEQQATMGERLPDGVDKSTGEIKERVLTAEELLNAVNAAISKLDEFTDLDAMGDWTAALDNLVKTDMRFTKAFKKNMDRIKAQP